MSLSKWVWSASRHCAGWVPLQKQKSILSEDVYNRFIKAYPVILDNTIQRSVFKMSAERVKRIVEYNMRMKNQTQGEITVLCHELLRETKQVEDDVAYKQYVLAWCIELLFTYGVISDDFEEGSKTRFNKTCWHLLPDVGTLVINDAVIVISLLYETLRQNFENPAYMELINVFNETILKYNIGQNLDAEMSTNRNYKVFTIEHYKTVACYKLGVFSLILPVQLALIAIHKHNEESFHNVSNIFTEIGIWSQINNDIQDLFNNDADTGKTGSDIEMGKCTWLAVTALKRCNDSQRKEFEDCYGSREPSRVKRIRELYKELNIIDIYFEEEEACYNNAISKIEALPLNVTPSRDFFRIVLDKYFANISYKLKL